MFFILVFLGISLTEIRIDEFGDTTAKFQSAYPEYPGVELLEEKLIELTNKERIKGHLPKLVPDSHLRIAARQHSLEMLEMGYFSHISPVNGNKTAKMRIYNSGLPQYKIGENLAESIGGLVPILIQENLDSLARIIHNGWMSSPHHRDNMLDKDYTHIGMGAMLKDTTLKVTQTFAQKAFGVDSAVVEKKGNKYLINIYLSSSLWKITVFMDEEGLSEDSIEYYYGRMKIPLRIKSGIHKIELCSIKSDKYCCRVRFFIDTNASWNNLFPVLTEFGN